MNNSTKTIKNNYPQSIEEVIKRIMATRSKQSIVNTNEKEWKSLVADIDNLSLFPNCLLKSNVVFSTTTANCHRRTFWVREKYFPSVTFSRVS